MKNSNCEKNLRILVIDDNRAIHEDFRKILCAPQATAHDLAADEAALFGEATSTEIRAEFEIDSAFQGQEGLELLQKALANGRPYAMAFIDVRMPPGWDGIETTSRIWELYPELQVVICTAYSDYSWDEMRRKLGNSDRLLILKKPFDAVEVLQLANALTEKWRLQQAARSKMEFLEEMLQERTKDLRATNASLELEICERERAADALAQKAALLDLAQDAVFVSDLEGCIQFWNKGAERLYGWTAAEVAGMNNAELLTPQSVPVIQAARKILLEKGEWNGELCKHTKAGKEVTVDSRCTLVRDKANQPASVLIINTDITEKKRLEAQFLRSQRMEGIGTLATGMAHDLNNILAPILMAAGALRYDLSDEDKRETINQIESGVKRGANIIQQVLTFGRGVSGERVAVNSVELVNDIAGIASLTFPKNIHVNRAAENGCWPILGDKTQLHQVLLNLAINARDAMPGGGTLTLTAKNVNVTGSFAAAHGGLRSGPHVELQVTDSGCGIPTANLERIFDPFFTTKEVGKGTGLGLSTALGIVKSHHGVMLVESEPSKGSVFKVLLPASSEALRLGQTAVPALPRGNGQTVLIVDDEANIISVTRRILEQNGYNVITANSGREALPIFSRPDLKIDVVITDILMPDMDGITLIQELKKLDPSIKIIPSSGSGQGLSRSDRTVNFEAVGGVQPLLDKPYTVEKLLNALHKALTET